MERSEEPFPAADTERELNPGAVANRKVEVDPVSAEVATSLKKKELNEADEKQRETERRVAVDKLKSTIIVSGIAVAVLGAVYAIVKKLKEK